MSLFGDDNKNKGGDANGANGANGARECGWEMSDEDKRWLWEHSAKGQGPVFERLEQPGRGVVTRGYTGPDGQWVPDPQSGHYTNPPEGWPKASLKPEEPQTPQGGYPPMPGYQQGGYPQEPQMPSQGGYPQGGGMLPPVQGGAGSPFAPDGHDGVKNVSSGPDEADWMNRLRRMRGGR